MSYVDELKTKNTLANLKLQKNSKWKNLIITIIVSLGALFFTCGLLYVGYTGVYLPSNYGLKTIGTVYKRESGRLSANDVYLYYKVKGRTYHVMGGVNSYENYIGKQVEMGEKFIVLYYPTHPDWSSVDLFMKVPDTLKPVTNQLVLSFQVEDELTGKLITDFITEIHTASTSDAYSPDSSGHILFVLPEKENVYTVKFLKENYATKSVQINTFGINKHGVRDFYLPARIGLIQIEKGVDYSVLTNPIVTAGLINDSTIA